jgi:hypothetical protein
VDVLDLLDEVCLAEDEVDFLRLVDFHGDELNGKVSFALRPQ